MQISKLSCHPAGEGSSKRGGARISQNNFFWNKSIDEWWLLMNTDNT